MSIAKIKTKTRQIIEDTTESTSDVFTYESDNVFTLTEDNVISVTTVLINSSEQGDSLWSYNSETNKVTVSSSLTSGDSVEIKYTCYQNYSNVAIVNYIQSALVHLSINGFYDFEYDATSDSIYPEPSINEENLIAMVTGILMEPDNKSFHLPNLTINVPKDLPTNQKISKIIAVAKKNSNGIYFIA